MARTLAQTRVLTLCDKLAIFAEELLAVLAEHERNPHPTVKKRLAAVRGSINDIINQIKKEKPSDGK
jgi:hypothetical protein